MVPEMSLLQRFHCACVGRDVLRLTWWGFLTLKQLSQASPLRSPSVSIWSRFQVYGQLSIRFSLPIRTFTNNDEE